MTPEAAFWDWFVENRAGLWNLPYGDRLLVTELRQRLDRVSPELMWEIGVVDDETREFVVGAGGVRDAIPHVRRLAEAAPTIPGWQITRFCPRKDPPWVEWEGIRLVAADVFFGFTADPAAGPPFSIVLYLPGLKSENLNALGSAAFVLLDGWLGEANVMTLLHDVRFYADGPVRSRHARPIMEMPLAMGLTP